MGEVYRARDPRLGRDVALKIVASAGERDADRLRRFEQEARAVTALNHPHVLAVHDVGSENGVSYVVFELLDGHTLRARLAHGPIPPRKAVEYGLQIGRGLAAAHSRGVVHRDLKPENVFLTSDGQIKILDFGLAKLTDVPEGELLEAATLTATDPGLAVGTAGYMSPEQARGKKADARSDVFALGAILYELLSGHPAFGGDTRADRLSAVLNHDPPDIASLTREPVSPGLRHDIVGEHLIGIAAHDLLDVFRLDAVDEPLFKRLDFRGIAGAFHCRLSPRLVRHVHDRLLPEYIGN
jgi:eukaryotic-like serine/threonine-protein kinase